MVISFIVGYAIVMIGIFIYTFYVYFKFKKECRKLLDNDSTNKEEEK